MMTIPSISIPMWTPLYNPPPHRFHDCKRIMLLCAAEPGRVQKLLPAPLESTGDFVFISWLKIGEVEGYLGSCNIAINFPCRYGEAIGKTCALEYIDVDMGLAAGREMWPWPKKGGDFVWNETDKGIHLECSRRGDLLFTSDVTFRQEQLSENWPEKYGAPDIGANNLQVRHIGNSHAEKPHTAEVLQVSYPNSLLHSSVAVDATLDITSGPRDSMSELGPLRVVAARYDHQEFDFDLGRVIGSHAL
ncbi:acetoacetate decarboxylase family protein [Ochrobactrum teleogrylli]|uniref:Acetoacetate decarboxylase n=2 Tax=Ochrobactrum teleogrylli TaxID=2479765 RepID=A0ABY2XYQ7_9HYPH|nr:hypothetical protein FIC94_20885 [[Ochrobactrum] teleogrylli]